MATRSGLRAAFFTLFCLVGLGHGGTARADGLDAPWAAALLARATAMQLADSPLWHALLHLHGGRPQITDPGFLLSAPRFSPAAELAATLAVLHHPDAARARQAACRFPARDAWLRAQLQHPPADTAHCTDWQTFQRKAPMASASLVFAAEVLSEPSSMMGHLFLRTDGVNDSGQRVAHAISYYTDASSWNLPKLFWNTMVVGQHGHFALNPYRDARERYAVAEQRPLWRYTLNLDETERQRLQAHMQELRETQLTYFFQSYNCATLVENLLRVARPTLPIGPGGWTTPREVLRRAEQGGLIAEVDVETPPRWRIRALSAALSATQVRAVDEAVQAADAPGMVAALQQGDTREPATDFLRWQLALADLTWRQDSGHAPATALASRKAAVQAGLQRFDTLSLDVDASNQPTRTPPERQLSVGWLQRGELRAWRLRAMPASHRLEDDHRSRMHDSELRLFEPTVLVHPDNGRVQLERFTLYGVRSLLPHDAITGGLSGHFQLAWAPQASARTPNRQAWLTEGSLGTTWRLHDDIDAYALMGGGVGWRQSPYAYAQPEVGVVIREFAHLKSWVRTQWLSRPLGAATPSHSWIWTQSWTPSPHWSVQAEWQTTRQGDARLHGWHLGVTHLF